jgi:hypothetical protein
MRDCPFNNSIEAADWESDSMIWKRKNGTTRDTVARQMLGRVARDAQDLLNSARERIFYPCRRQACVPPVLPSPLFVG